MVETGWITNVEYLYDEESKKYRIYYREDLGNNRVRYSLSTEKRVSDFFPVLYKKRTYSNDPYNNKRTAYNSLLDSELKLKMNDVFWGGQGFTFPKDNSVEELNRAFNENNKIWYGYPFLKSLRKENISSVTDIRIDRDRVIYEPIYEKTGKLSYRNFLKESMKKHGIDNITNKIEAKYQWVAQHVYEKCNTNIKLRHLFLDIETRMEAGNSADNPTEPITLIQVNDSYENKNYIFFYEHKKDEFIPEKGVNYIPCKDEKEMLVKYVNLVKELNPVCISAFFGDGFDFKYITNRMRNLAISEPDNVFYLKNLYNDDGKLIDTYCALLEELSPYGKVKDKKVVIFGEESHFIVPVGRYYIDYLELYRQYSYGERESYKLDSICLYELGEGKVEYVGVENNLNDLYEKNFDLFMKYGVQDVKLLYNLESKIKYLNIAFMRSYTMGVNIEDVLSTIYPWMHKLHIEYIRRGYIIPPKAIEIEGIEFEGGYTYCPSPGKKRDVACYDFTSLYPKTCESFNISYETLVEEDDWDTYDKTRYLFIKYALFDKLLPEIIEVSDNKIKNLRDFTFQSYKKFFSVKVIQGLYLGEDIKSSEAFNILLSKMISDFDNNLSKKISLSLKIAALSMSPIGVFFENEAGFTKEDCSKLLYNIYNSNMPKEDRVLLEFYLDEYFENIVVDQDRLIKDREAIYNKYAENCKKANKEIKHKNYDELFSFIYKIDPNKALSTNRSINLQCFAADIKSRKGILPIVISKTFLERKAAKKQLKKYEILLNNIEKVKIEKKSKAL